ncbi:hypothetical protein [Kutzneria sp. NPDC051319]|uniref:hypothetical protein n=1 Tax=Kutzneria sp. NPDC051319 TaxID=3155047 RepID=UPI0034191B91
MVFPVRRCKHCEGMGRIRVRFGGVRPCLRCRGIGFRLRTGRRAWNWLSREFEEARRGLRTRQDRAADRDRRDDTDRHR